MTWLLLLGAIACEVAGTLSLRASDGFSRLGPSLAVLAGYCLSFYLLSVVLRRLPLSLTYAVWSGLGTAVIAVIGMVAFAEPRSAVRIACIVAIVSAVAGLRLTGSA